MRENLFKAKRINNGEWVKGYFSKYPKGRCTVDVILDKCKNPPDSDPMWERILISYEVDPETVCQYIGWNDSNKKKIWENDIVEVIWYSGKIERYLIWWSREMSMMEAISLNDINFNGNDYWGGQSKIEYSTFCLMMQDPWGDIKEVKVIGNIFDNPELLKVNQ